MTEKSTVVKWMKNYLVSTFKTDPANELVNCFGVGQVDLSALAEDYVFDSGHIGADENRDGALEDENHPAFFDVYDGSVDAAEWFEKNYSRPKREDEYE